MLANEPHDHRELNRNQGFGFALRGQRITKKMITRTMPRRASASTLACSAQLCSAHVANEEPPDRKVSPQVPLLLWQVPALAGAWVHYVGAHVHHRNARDHQVQQVPRQNVFVFGDDAGKPWDDEAYRQYIHSQY